jgi:LacI family transcriptional regulator
MATIKEVAARARVSVGTVSNVLSGVAPVSPKLRERVEDAIRRLDYHPNHAARSLKSRHTRTLGMMVSDITNPFFPLLVRGAEDAAMRQGYSLTVLNTDDRLDRERQAVSFFRMRRADGLLAVVSSESGGGAHLREAMRSGMRLVCVDRVPPHFAADAVVVNNRKGSLICLRHLISRGHRRIGVITGPRTLETAVERLAGYRQALEEAGLPYDAGLVREGDFRLESGYRLAKDLCLAHPRPTAIFAGNGMMGLGVVKALDELHLDCPSDVALAVFDDVPAAEILRPHLTVVSQPAYQMGTQAVELLLRRISGEAGSSRPVRIELEPELIIRESTTGPAR